MCESKSFVVVMQGTDGSYKVRIEADYFTTGDGYLTFYKTMKNTAVAAFSGWVYVVEEG